VAFAAQSLEFTLHLVQLLIGAVLDVDARSRGA
jgi:hypothetical protein